MQQGLGFSPLKTGVAFLPMTLAIVVTSTTVQTQLLHRLGREAAGRRGHDPGRDRNARFHPADARRQLPAYVLPGLIVIGLGMGFIFAPAFVTATLGVKSTEAGVASAMVNTSQQVGGSVGTALLGTIFASAAASFAAAHVGSSGVGAAAAIHGYTTAFWWAAAISASGCSSRCWCSRTGPRPGGRGDSRRLGRRPPREAVTSPPLGVTGH